MSSPNRKRTDERWDDNHDYWTDELVEERDERPWADRAACLGLDTGMFYTAGQRASALAICASCPIRLDCLTYALKYEDHYGVQGGVTASDRRSWLGILTPGQMIEASDINRKESLTAAA